MNRPALPLLLTAVLLAVAPSHGAQATRSARPTHFQHQVEITPSTLPAGSTAIDIGPDRWSVQGFDLRALLARIYDIDPALVDLGEPTPDPAAAAAQDTASSLADPELPRFDVSLPLSGEESDAAIRQLLTHALELRLHLVAALENRTVEVFVLTRSSHPGPDLRPHLASDAPHASAHLRGGTRFLALPSAFEPPGDPEPEIITIAGRVCPGISSAGITARSATIPSFTRALEAQLGRPILDETHLTGAFDFELPEYRSRDELFALLHDRLGIDVSVTRRELPIVTVHSAAPPAGSPAGDMDNSHT